MQSFELLKSTGVQQFFKICNVLEEEVLEETFEADSPKQHRDFLHRPDYSTFIVYSQSGIEVTGWWKIILWDFTPSHSP